MKNNKIKQRVLASALALTVACGCSAFTAFAADTGSTANSSFAISLNSSGITLELNNTYNLPQFISGITGLTYQASSSNERVFKVKDGKIYTVGTGTAILSIKLPNGTTVKKTVTVKKPEVSINLSAKEINMTPGEITSVKAVASNTNSRLVYSSSNTTVVTVDQNGKLTAKKDGSAVITVKTSDNSKSVTCKVNVSGNVGITLGNNSVKLGNGEKFTLNYTLTKNTNASSKNVSFSSSNTTIATVDASGTVTAKKSGTATITAKTSSGKTATCKITVEAAPASIKFTNGKLTLGSGERLTLKYTLSANSASNRVTFSSNNTAVASVDQSGNITTNKEGTATITAKTYNGKTATCTITVKSAPKTINFINKTVTVGSGEKYKLNYSISADSASNKITFSSNNAGVVTVDSSGNITTKKEGTATITAKTYNGKTTTCTITVKSAPTSVKFLNPSITVKVGQTVTLTPSVNIGAASASKTYTTSNSSVANVNASGSSCKFTASKTGTATITVRTYNGKTATCTVKVVK